MTLGPLLLLLAGLPAAPAPAPEDPAKPLQGNWKLASLKVNGNAAEPKKVAAWDMTIKGDTITSRESGEVVEEATFRLDVKPQPHAIDLSLTAGPDKGKTVLGIYQLKGDELTVCMAEPGKERPKEFTSAAGAGHTLFVFKRARP